MIKDTQLMNFLDEFCAELNRLRNDPKSYIPVLEDRRHCMKKGVLKVGPGIKKQTVEGSAAIKEAIQFLENASPTIQQIKFDSAISGPSQVYTQDDAVKTFVIENQLEDVDYFAYSELSKES